MSSDALAAFAVFAEHLNLTRAAEVHVADLARTELIVPPPTRPHRINLEQALTNAGVTWTVAVEAEGLPMTLDFAALGVGLAVVAGCVRPAPGLTTRRITDLPNVTFHAVNRPARSTTPAPLTSSPGSARVYP